MEYFEGAPYRINIEGGDSTLVLNSYTRTLKASVVDPEENIIVDFETGTFFGTLVGNIVSSDNNIILNLEHSAITIDTISGNLVALDGSISYNHETQIFNGQFNGNVSGKVNGDVIGSSGSTLVNYDNNLVTCDVYGNLLNYDHTVAFDNETKTFQGTFVGDFLDSEGNVLFSSDRINTDEINIFKGSLTGDVIGIDGAVLVDYSNNLVMCDVHGNLLNYDRTVAFDNETNTFQGNFVGNFLDSDGNVLFSSEDFNLGGFNTDGVETGIFIGNVFGNIVSEDGNVLLDSAVQTLTINSVWAETLYGDLAGTLVGNVIREDGGVIVDAGTNVINAEAVHATTITGNLTGTFTGDIIFGNIKGDLCAENIILGDSNSAHIYVKNETDITENFGPLSIEVFKTSNEMAAITLTRGSGTIESPQVVQSGNSLFGILFAGVVEADGTADNYSLSPAAWISSNVASDGVVNTTRIEAELTFGVVDSNGEQLTGLTINKYGQTITTLKDVSIVGETGNAPTNTGTPTKWLEMTVNGETVFMPLYS